MAYKQIKARHREIARMIFQGQTPKQIASQLEMATGTITQLQRDPLFKAHLATLEDNADEDVLQVRKILSSTSVRAAQVLNDIITFREAPPSVIVSAAKDILDRTGHAPKTQVEHTHGHFTAKDLLELRERAIGAGATLEAEYTPVGA